MPLVVMGRPFRSDNVSYIDIDNVNSAYNAVTHLVRLGYQRIATITGPTTSTVGIDRKEGYKKALLERGRVIDASLIKEGDFTEAGGYYAMQQLLSAKPDAIFAASDIMAIGAMRAVRDAGLCVPDDIAFVGFDDLPLAPLSDVQLTTIRQPVVPFGVKAVEVLIDLICPATRPCTSTVSSGARLLAGIPYSNSNNNAMAIAQQDNARVIMFETPYLYNMLDGKVYPLLADGDYAWNDARTEITFKIKPPPKWSDGTPVTAEDVAYTWATHVKYNTPTGAGNKDYIEDIEAVDAQTVVIKAKLDEKARRSIRCSSQLT
jgi:hypothetical protein